MEIHRAGNEWKQACSTETLARIDGWMPCDVSLNALAENKW